LKASQSADEENQRQIKKASSFKDNSESKLINRFGDSDRQNSPDRSWGGGSKAKQNMTV